MAKKGLWAETTVDGKIVRSGAVPEAKTHLEAAQLMADTLNEECGGAAGKTVQITKR